MTRRRSTAHITLVLIGTASISGCGNAPDPARHRDVYRSRVDCVQEWRADRLCERIVGGQYDGYFYGPPYDPKRVGRREGEPTGSTSSSYRSSSGFSSSSVGHESRWRSDPSTVPRQDSRAVATSRSASTAASGGSRVSGSSSSSSVSRGGFGSSASAHSSGS